MSSEKSAAVSTVEPANGNVRSDFPIVFFDGVCGLCNSFVDFAMPRDRRKALRFAPLQGETAQSIFGECTDASLDTVVLHDGKTRYIRSAAVVRVLWQLGGVWMIWGSLLWLIPLPLRDFGYRLVAANRYRVFGKKESCRMPTPEERQQLLP